MGTQLLPDPGEHMTPEDDVNKDSEQNGGEKPAENDAADFAAKNAAKKAADDKLEENAAAADDAIEGVVESSVTSTVEGVDGAEQDDIDRAAKAQNTADEAIAKAMSGGDDPLGFGDQRMEGDAANSDLAGEGDEMSVLRAQLGESEAKAANHADQLLRLQAEMENQRKRAQNDVTKAHKFALEKIAIDLLPVKDSLEMGLLAATAEDAEPTKIIEGSELTLKMLGQALEKYNIVEINPVDEKFDPEFHQAMSMQPVEGKEPNTVASVMQKGYTLNDRLIRPALVMVAK